MTALADLVAHAAPRFDLTEPADQAALRELAEALLAHPEATPEAIAGAARAPSAPLQFKVAAKLVAARRAMARIDDAVELGVVFAMWGETNRLRPKSADNPNGEDALRVKLDQLAWATEGAPVSWRLYAVDDGCPDGSGALARTIAADHPLGDRVEVLALADALPADGGALANLASADDSRKGGAILHGCERALADGVDAVVYTDADNSVHLGQLGLLLEPFANGGVDVVLGNRKHPDAVLVKQEARWGIGITALRHMQRMVGREIFLTRGIKDTQAAFKLYGRDVLEAIVANPSVYDFSFDTDWIFAVLAEDVPYTTVPFAFIDSFAESASIEQGPMTTWETLLKGLVAAARSRGVPHDEAMAAVIDDEIGDSSDLDLLIDHLPPELEGVDPGDIGKRAVMGPEAMRAWIRERKRG